MKRRTARSCGTGPNGVGVGGTIPIVVEQRPTARRLATTGRPPRKRPISTPVDRAEGPVGKPQAQARPKIANPARATSRTCSGAQPRPRNRLPSRARLKAAQIDQGGRAIDHIVPVLFFFFFFEPSPRRATPPARPPRPRAGGRYRQAGSTARRNDRRGTGQGQRCPGQGLAEQGGTIRHQDSPAKCSGFRRQAVGNVQGPERQDFRIPHHHQNRPGQRQSPRQPPALEEPELAERRPVPLPDQDQDHHRRNQQRRRTRSPWPGRSIPTP